jgi:hypothetical protein
MTTTTTTIETMPAQAAAGRTARRVGTALLLRIEAPVGSTLLFPVYVGVAVWAGACLRDPAVRRFVLGQPG